MEDGEYPTDVYVLRTALRRADCSQRELCDLVELLRLRLYMGPWTTLPRLQGRQ